MGTGGYRWGAGRPGWKRKAEHCRRIDARRWQREGILNGWASGSWVWRDAETGEQTASIGYRGEAGAVCLSYRVDGESVVQRVPILHTACNYGGARTWFGCPCCGRRVAVLFLAGGRFRCRHCGRVAYGSQSDDASGRAWRQQAKAEAKLNPDGSKPKGMRWATYARLRAVILDCEERRDNELTAAALRLFPHLKW